MAKRPDYAYIAFGGTGTEARGDLEDIAYRFFQGTTYALQQKALVAGLRAYIRISRLAAQRAAYATDFKKASAYRSAVRKQSRWMVRGYLYSGGGYGNILEAGADAHWAPLDDQPIEKGKYAGEMLPGVARWMKKHAPDVLAAYSSKSRFVKVKARTGRPWVIPAAMSVQEEAYEVFKNIVVDVVWDGIE